MNVKANRIINLVICVIVIILTVTGCMGPSSCGGPSARGWSGFAGIDKLIYTGSMDGDVLAINPLVRQAGGNFPGQGEWEYVITVPTAGNVCGPFLSCGQEAATAKAVIYSSPAISADLVYVGTYSGKVMAISRSEPTKGADFPSRKKNEWVFPKTDTYIGAVIGNLILFEDTLFVCTADGKVYALDAKYGDKKWEFQTNKRIWSSPAVSEGVVYFGGFDGKLYAISSRDGSKLWQSDLPAVICSSPVIYQDTIYFGTFDRYLYAVKKADATIKWKFRGGNWFWAEPVVKDGTIYAGCLDSKIYAINAVTGTQIWQFTADKPIISKLVIVSDSVVAVSESGTIYILDISNGTSKKTISVGYSVMAPLYTQENTVYIHARDNSIHALDVRSGELVWKFKKDKK
jgi:outer membrane protein assembly factor BamB